MKAKYLFPAILRPLGFIMAIPGLVLGYLCAFDDYEITNFGFQMREKTTFFQPGFENLTNELAVTLVVTGLLFIAFARRKREDELTAKLRLDALYWGVIINYVVYYGVFLGSLAAKAFLAEDTFHKSWVNLLDMPWYIYNIITPLIIFIFRYYYLLYFKKETYVIAPLRYFSYKPFGVIGKYVSIPLLMLLVVAMCLQNDHKIFGDLSGYLFYGLPFFLILWAYSKQENEDEMVAQLRMESLQLAVYFNYFLLIFLSLIVYGLGYYIVLFSNFFTLLLFFCISFEYKKYKYFKTESALAKGGLLL